ncbi:MAG TPA: glycosyltransferase family 39 protein [Pyrinomonadaceae bacterium]|nr:glycosyltransferase family 39 protein [Pyrinomonadaceae bacterium]
MQSWASSRRLPWIALSLLLAVVVAREAALLWRYPVAVGIDGYYYVLQIRQLTETGRLYFSTHTPFFVYLLAALTQLTRNSLIAIKLSSLLLNAFLALGIFAIISNLTRNLWVALVGSVLALAPQSHLFMSAEYLNNLAAVVFLLWSAWVLLRAAETRKLKWLALGGALLIAAGFSHRSAGPVALTLAACGLLLRCLWQRRQLAGWLGIAIFWLLPALVSVQRWVVVPSWLQSEISFRPRSPFLAPVIPEELLLAASSVLLLFLIFRRVHQNRVQMFDYVFGTIALWSLLVTLNPFLDPQAVLSGVAGRLRILASVQVALITPALLWLSYCIRRQLALYFAAVFLPLIILSMLAPLPYGLQSDFLSRRERLIQALRFHAGELAPNSIVVAPHGDQFVVTATIGVPAQQVVPINYQGVTVYWLLNEVNDPALEGESLILMKDEAATLLVKDTTLKTRLQSMTSEQRQRLLRTNSGVAMARL